MKFLIGARGRLCSAGIVLTLSMSCFALLAKPAHAQDEAAKAEAAAHKTHPMPGSYRMLRLQYAANTNYLADVQTALRNLLPNAKIYAIANQNTIALWASDEDFALAQKVVADLDKPHQGYRVSFALIEMDGAKRLSERHYSLVAWGNERSSLKQGRRIPILTGTAEKDSAAQVQYVDVGLNLEATVSDGQLRVKVEESAISTDKPATATSDPIVEQMVLTGNAPWANGKPVVLGLLALPGSTHHAVVEATVDVLP